MMADTNTKSDNAQPETPKFDPTKIWESQSLEYDRALTVCAFSPCGKYVVAGARHEDVQRWELATGTRTPLVGHRSWTMALAFHPDQKRLMTGDYHGVVHCWSHADAAPKPQWTIQDTGHGWVRDLKVSPDGKHLLTTGNDNVVRLWSTEAGKPVREFTGHKHHVFSLAIAGDSKTFYSGDLLGKIHQWDIASGKLLRTIDASVLHTRKDNFLADIGGVRRIVLSDDGKLLVCSGMTDAKGNTFCVGKAAVLVFDLASGKLKQTLRPKTPMDGPLEGLCFLPDGTITAQGQMLNRTTTSIEFWKVEKAEPYHILKTLNGYSLHLHPDKLRLASACYLTNGRGGNGRHTEKKDYASNNGALKVYSLFEKPAEEKAKKA